jgi:(p)ppGpp synthase/HD superfamily hydrolase
MKTPVLIELAIQTVMLAFAGEIRSGPLSIPSSTHSLRVGLSLMKWGYSIEICLGGFFHDIKEDTTFSEEFIKKKFGNRHIS